jgi:hypothetical protein
LCVELSTRPALGEQGIDPSPQVQPGDHHARSNQSFLQGFSPVAALLARLMLNCAIKVENILNTYLKVALIAVIFMSQVYFNSLLYNLRADVALPRPLQGYSGVG